LPPTIQPPARQVHQPVEVQSQMHYAHMQYMAAAGHPVQVEGAYPFAHAVVPEYSTNPAAAARNDRKGFVVQLGRIVDSQSGLEYSFHPSSHAPGQIEVEPGDYVSFYIRNQAYDGRISEAANILKIPDPKDMLQGHVKTYSKSKHHGYITAADSLMDVYFHINDVLNSADIQPGDYVHFLSAGKVKLGIPAGKALHVKKKTPPMPLRRSFGFVRAVNEECKYGCIAQPNGIDVFVHFRDTRLKSIRIGDFLDFSILPTKKGDRAVYVKRKRCSGHVREVFRRSGEGSIVEHHGAGEAVFFKEDSYPSIRVNDYVTFELSRNPGSNDWRATNVLYNRDPPDRLGLLKMPPWNIQFSLPVPSAVRRASGLIRSFNPTKGWGFITKTYEKFDVFFSREEFLSVHDPRVGDYVEFDLHESPRGLRAHQIETKKKPQVPLRDFLLLPDLEAHEMEGSRQYGLVKSWQDKGWGHIVSEKTMTEVFVHSSGIRNKRNPELNVGDRVEYELETTERGVQALDVVKTKKQPVYRRKRGYVSVFHQDKGLGRIAMKGGESVFVHKSQAEGKQLKVGDYVFFNMVTLKDGGKAFNVKIVRDENVKDEISAEIFTKSYGTLKSYFTNKSYGFIIDKDGGEYFFHENDCLEENPRTFKNQELMEYLKVGMDKQKRAIQVRRVERVQPAKKISKTIRSTGTVKSKDWGSRTALLKDAGGGSLVTLHASDLVGGGFDNLRNGLEFEYDLDPNERCALNALEITPKPRNTHAERQKGFRTIPNKRTPLFPSLDCFGRASAKDVRDMRQQPLNNQENPIVLD